MERRDRQLCHIDCLELMHIHVLRSVGLTNAVQSYLRTGCALALVIVYSPLIQSGNIFEENRDILPVYRLAAFALSFP